MWNVIILYTVCYLTNTVNRFMVIIPLYLVALPNSKITKTHFVNIVICHKSCIFNFNVNVMINILRRLFFAYWLYFTDSLKFNISDYFTRWSHK